MRRRIVEREEYPLPHGVVDRLCGVADVPEPRVAVADMEMFAPLVRGCGSSPS